MDWEIAPDILALIKKILYSDLFPHIDSNKITAIRGRGTTSRAIARIWSLPRPWQMALSVNPQYIIEVIAERFDKMRIEDQERTLIHELMHIPKSFSGALTPHRNRGRHVNSRNVEVIYQQYKASSWRERSDR